MTKIALPFQDSFVLLNHQTTQSKQKRQKVNQNNNLANE
jgi:hypothetical protein